MALDRRANLAQLRHVHRERTSAVVSALLALLGLIGDLPRSVRIPHAQHPIIADRVELATVDAEDAAHERVLDAASAVRVAQQRLQLDHNLRIRRHFVLRDGRVDPDVAVGAHHEVRAPRIPCEAVQRAGLHGRGDVHLSARLRFLAHLLSLQQVALIPHEHVAVDRAREEHLVRGGKGEARDPALVLRQRAHVVSRLREPRLDRRVRRSRRDLAAQRIVGDTEDLAVVRRAAVGAGDRASDLHRHGCGEMWWWWWRRCNSPTEVQAKASPPTCV